MGKDPRPEYERLFEYPFDFQEYVERRLWDIEDLEERKFAKMLLQDGLMNIIYRTEESYKELEHRVYQELRNSTHGYSVYMTICSKETYDPIHPFLFSIRQEDLQPLALTAKGILEAIEGGEKPRVSSFYLDGTYADCIKLLEGGSFFQGELVTSHGNVSAEFSVGRDEHYMKSIQRLYLLFCNNNIPWSTINCAYLMRFFQIHLYKLNSELPMDAELQKVIVNFGNMQSKILYDIIPVWNVKTIPVKSADFMVPCIDIVAWEHKISLKELGVQNQYLIHVEGEISGYRREADELTITTTEQDLPSLTMYMIAKKGPPLPLHYTFPVLGNEKKDSFLKRLEENTGPRLRTKAELFRQIHEMSMGEFVEFDSVQIISETSVRKIGYNMNPFIKDELIDRDTSRVLLLKFRKNDDAHGLSEDMVSFVVSEVQLTFDEYRCEGVFV